ncbi:D-alanyl-D-alanine carboxypeptidase [Blastococcus brunescens]|uniref:D-alanyl-D-alanine carboxypeptidase n=1 Tax=Blastococcus brunescens TaxID=1564165 RepID=A0ABZ1B134_9ACTN|nr:D-alanyl-D-alanine carboxypeptidase [Blastococcus sp. BMG 8361]WRL64530.1 D-alanyl-D-alanine carboxypeptidase [Blastococcus sp. BMG 8361]
MGTIASSGSTIVTAKTGRFRRRIAMGVVGLVLLLIGGGVGVGLLLTGGGGDDGSVAVPDAQLPDLGEAAPVLAALGSEAPMPDPGVLSSELTPLLTAAGLGTGVSAEVVDVATGEVLLDLDADDPAVPASTVKLLTAAAVLSSLDPADTLTTTVVAGATPGRWSWSEVATSRCPAPRPRSPIPARRRWPTSQPRSPRRCRPEPRSAGSSSTTRCSAALSPRPAGAAGTHPRPTPPRSRPPPSTAPV